MTVAVSDVNEAPELVGDTELDYEENGTDQVVRYIATDPEGSSVIWTLSGTDADIDALFAAGVTVGCSAEPLLFCPQRPTLRAEMASFLTRALELQDSG